MKLVPAKDLAEAFASLWLLFTFLTAAFVRLGVFTMVYPMSAWELAGWILISGTVLAGFGFAANLALGLYTNKAASQANQTEARKA